MAPLLACQPTVSAKCWKGKITVHLRQSGLLLPPSGCHRLTLPRYLDSITTGVASLGKGKSWRQRADKANKTKPQIKTTTASMPPGSLSFSFVPSIALGASLHRPAEHVLERRLQHRSFVRVFSRRNSKKCYPYACADAAKFTSESAAASPVTPSIPLDETSTSSSASAYNHQTSASSLSRISVGLWKFSRPHTVYGSVIAILSLTVLARQHSPAVGPLPVLASCLTALVPALLINIYIVGLNQVFDIEIDRINKPFLPIPAGIMTKRDAITVVLVSLVSGLSFCFAPLATPALRAVLIGSTLLGTMYSAPPFRLKRFALLASIAILVVRGVLINVAFFLHGTAAGGVAVAGALPPLLKFATAFFMIFGIVIALLKDAPDIRGDRVFGIRTFSVRLGARAIFKACASTLVAMFSVAAVFYFRMSNSLIGGVLAAATHLLVAAELARRAMRVDTDSSKQIYDFYMFSWKTFYLEYILLPMAAL